MSNIPEFKKSNIGDKITRFFSFKLLLILYNIKICIIALTIKILNGNKYDFNKTICKIIRIGNEISSKCIRPK